MDGKTAQLMFALITVSQAQDLVVSQPSSAQAMEGSSITLRCSYNSTSEPKIGSYQWVKDPGLVVKNSSQEFMGKVNYISDQDFLLMRKADLEIRDLRPSDSGLYRCMVNILGLTEASGKGTELQVIRTARDLVVYQPSSAQGTEGGSITLKCSYRLPSEPKVGSYHWVKYPGLLVKNTSQEFMGRVNCTSDQGFLSEKRADIEITDLRLNDSGMYHCVVNIHGLQETSGNGTGLQVTRAGPKNGAPRNDVNMVLVWLLVRGVLCTTGIVTVALVTRAHYANTGSDISASLAITLHGGEGPNSLVTQEVQKRRNHCREYIYKTATRN